MFYSIESSWRSLAEFWVSLVPLLKDWQTLIGAGVAILAAWIAARPIWRQLERMEFQTSAVLREVLVDRIADAEKAEIELAAPFDELLNQGRRDLDLWDDVDIPEIGAETAFHWESVTTRAATEFSRLSRLRKDSRPIEAAKAAVIAAAKALAAALDDIHAPQSLDRDDPESPVNAEAWAAIEEQGRSAPERIPRLASTLITALEDLRSARRSEIECMRLRLRKVDDRLLA